MVLILKKRKNKNHKRNSVMITKKQIQLSDHFTMKRLLVFVLPSIVMMIFTSIYGVVDGLFVSNYAGKTAFAALNLIMPFIMILGGTGFMIGAGGTALVTKVLGEGDKEKANRYFSMLIIFTVILGVILTALGMIFIRPIALLLKATDNMIDYCVLYGRIVTAFTIPYMLQNVFQSFLIAAEKPKLGLLVTLVAGFENMILDWLFVAVFNWGIAGAAVATGISQCAGGFIPFIFFCSPKSNVLRFTPAKLELKPILQTCWNGSSELMSNISSSVVGIIYNLQLLKYVGEDGVSAYGVLMYVNFIFVAAFIGYSIGCAPIIGFNYGAKNQKELKNILKKSLYSMGISGVSMTILSLTCASILTKIFVGYDQALYQLTYQAFIYSAFSFILSGFNIFTSSFFTALNNGAISAIVSFMRTLIFQCSSVIILPLFLDVTGIWLAATVAEICAFLLSLTFLLCKRKKYGY